MFEEEMVQPMKREDMIQPLKPIAPFIAQVTGV